MPDVDVVIATYNRCGPLQQTLRGLARQQFRDFRVIVVDDGSSPPVASSLPASLWEQLDLTVLEQQNGGPGVARNNGVAAGDSRLVAFIDDDVVPDPDWLEQHVAAVGEAPVVSIGPLLAPGDWRPTAWNRWEAERLAVEYRRMLRGEYKPTWRQFFTGNVMFPRALFEAAGPFRTDFLRAEDIELAVRIEQAGGRFVFNPAAGGWHYARRPLRSWLALPRQYATYDCLIDELHPEAAPLRLIRRELSERHPLSRRMAAMVERLPMLRPLAVRMGVAASLGLDRIGARKLASRGLSLVYDLEYRAALAAATRTS